MQKNAEKHLFGFLLQALLGNFAVGALTLLLGNAFGGPKIYIEPTSAFYAFLVLMGFFLLLTAWCISTLIKNRTTQNFATTGPYRYIRHPLYSAIIFLLNPALAILFRSWLAIFAIIAIYFIWQKYASKKEKYLGEKFGQPYWQYCQTTWRFLPNLWRVNPHTKFGVGVNKILFYALTALLIFAVTFVCLNFSAVYLRWVSYGKKPAKISYDNKTQPSPTYFQQMFEAGFTNPSENQATSPQYNPNYSEQSNSIIIYKINVRAPLVFASGTSQKDLNNALNQGVLIYPGSTLPGQNGEVFLSGHSSIFPWVKSDYGQVFTLLDKLEAGDVVSLIYDHHQYDYRILSKQILAPKDTKISSTSEPTLTLMTCWPIGTALKRLVVRAELIR